MICAFTTYYILDNTVGFPVHDASGGNRTDHAWHVVISHGINGHGAFLPSGQRYSSGSTNANEKLNCHCDSDATPTAFSASFMMREVTENKNDKYDVFDDMLIYGDRRDLRSPNDEAGLVETCP